MKTQGNTPSWQPSVLTNEEEPESTVDEAESDVEEETGTEETPPEQEEIRKKTYESFADRLPNVKKERNKRLYRRLTLIVSIFLIAILIVLYFVSPLSKLGNISVSGNKHIDGNELITQSKLQKGDSLWEQFFDRNIYEKNIQRRLPRVKKAAINLSGLNSFMIKVEEYKVVALESAEGSYRPILENGKILSEVTSAPESGLPIFQNFEDADIIKNLINSYNKLPEEIKNNISEIRYAPSKSNKELVNIYMKDSNRVIVNISQLSEKMAYYQQVSSQMTERGVIDMEVGIFSYSFEKEKTDQSVEESTEENPEENPEENLEVVE